MKAFKQISEQWIWFCYSNLLFWMILIFALAIGLALGIAKNSLSGNLLYAAMLAVVLTRFTRYYCSQSHGLTTKEVKDGDN